MQKQKLEQKNNFHLIPIQIQAIKLLSLDASEIEEIIKNEIEENEALQTDDNQEEEYENSADFILKEKEEKNYSQNNEIKPEIPIGVEHNFLDNIENQFNSLDLTIIEKVVGKFIIGSLDNDGYLRRDYLDILDDLLFNKNIDISEEKLIKILAKIKSLEPAGIGAKNLQECLLIQLERKEKSLAIESTINIIKNFYDLFIGKKFDEIITKTKISQEGLKKILKIISKLNPKPLEGNANTSQTIVPDYILKIDLKNNLTLELNEKYIPKIRISKEYQDLAKIYKENSNKEVKKAFSYVSQKIQGAKWFLEALNQRQNTLTKIGEYLINYQKNYFLSGDRNDLKPLTQNELAEKLNMDKATISRVVSNKYIDTPYEIIKLKKIFSGKVNEKNTASSIKIKEILKDIISDEDKNNPLSDEKITKIFSTKGYKIARRTVTKYREDLNIPVARLRKEL